MAVIAIDTLKLILRTEFKGAAQLKQLDKAMASVDKQVKKVDKGMGNLNARFLGFGLALLFGGMAMKKFGQDMIRSITNAFTNLADASNVGMKGILTLQASLQFLKFILFDTFARTDMFANFVEGVVNIINKLSEFIQLHPGLTKFIFVFLALTFLIGAVVMVLGQLFLAAIGIAGAFLFGLGPAIGLLFALIVVTALLVAIWTADIPLAVKIFLSVILVVALLTGTFWTLLIVVLILIGMWYAIKAVAESNLNPIIKLLLIVGITMAGLIIIALLLGVAITLPFLIVIAVIAVLIGAFVLMVNRLGSVTRAFRAFGIFLLAIFAAIGDVLIEALIMPLRGFIALINGVITAIQFAGFGKDLTKIDQPEAFMLSKRVFEMRNDLLNEADQAQLDQDAAAMEMSEATQESFSDKIANKIGDVLGENGIVPSPDAN